MNAAVDFGCSWVRSAFRSSEHPDRLTMFSERAEYALLAKTEQHLQILNSSHIPYAECDDSIVVIGNQAAAAHWLSRVPCAPLFAEGRVPTEDRPARQMLGLLIDSILPKATASAGTNLCVMTVPGSRSSGETISMNADFLSRLVQGRGYETLIVRPAQAAILSTCNDARFTGLAVDLGAESTDLCVSRYGMPIASADVPIGSNWIDSELARQFQLQRWDEQGNCYLDLDSVREWKHYADLHLRNAVSERERALTRLFSVVMDRICASIISMLNHDGVRHQIGKQRLPVILCGGSARLKGFASLLTERFIDHNIASRVLSVRCADDPETAALRGCLICAELESQVLQTGAAA